MKTSLKLITGFFLILVLKLLSGCGTGSSKTDDSAIAPAPQYGKDTIMYCLSLFANINFGMTATPAELQQHAVTGINTVLANDTVNKLIGSWKVVWGPVAFTENTNAGDTCITDNLMVVLQGMNPSSPADTMYVVAIAATNFISTYDWELEDLDVDTMARWPGAPVAGQCNFSQFAKPYLSGNPDTTNAGIYISKGFTNAMNIHLNTMVDASGQTLIQYLRTILQNSSSAIEVGITGHSLAGTLSPLVATALKDNQGYWNSSGSCKVTAYSTAGPSPGNANFANYFQSNIGDNFHGVRNMNDVAPYAFNAVSMAQMPTIYNSINTNLNNQCILIGMLGCMTNEFSNFNYTTLYNTTDVFSGQITMNWDSVYTNAGTIYKSLSSTDQALIHGLAVHLHCMHFWDNAEPFFARTVCFAVMAGNQHSVAYENYFGATTVSTIFSRQLQGGTTNIFSVGESILHMPMLKQCE